MFLYQPLYICIHKSINVSIDWSTYLSIHPLCMPVLFSTTLECDCTVLYLGIFVLYLEIYVNAVFTEYDCTVLSWEHDFIIYYIAVLFSTWEYDLTFLFWEHDFVIIYL